MTRESRTISVEAFGESHEVECWVNEPDSDGRIQRADSILPVLVGRFPTGTKLHRSPATLWNRNGNGPRPLPGPTAAVIDGEEFVLSLTLYTHNRNNGRIVGWHETSMAATRAGW